MLKKLNRNRDVVMPAFAPTMTEADVQEWRALLAQAAPATPFMRLIGLVTGLVVTDNAPPAQALSLLGVKGVPARLTELTQCYAKELQAALDADAYAPPPELSSDLSAVTDWLEGLGQASILNFQRFMFILVAPEDMSILREVLLAVAAFASWPLGAPELRDPPAETRKQCQRNRQHFLRQWSKESLSERRALMVDLVTTLGTGFALASVVPGLGPSGSGSFGSSGLGAYDILNSGGTRRVGRKTGPNEPCPCGSGKKYKKCHGAPGAGPLPAVLPSVHEPI
ncbi:SEC-C metal-binding domain-containing protein [Deinococcus sp.]|uniref:SEC-C metal-binding domain-containing protein n=1 Tax=Deinococcus sp. TaxID=47478 RepID=UPI0025E41A3B|nr:SEC-C metal-binding domain-containing protein [Deinococcus sp.]